MSENLNTDTGVVAAPTENFLQDPDLAQLLSRQAALLGHSVPAHRYGMMDRTAEGVAMAGAGVARTAGAAGAGLAAATTVGAGLGVLTAAGLAALGVALLATGAAGVVEAAAAESGVTMTARYDARNPEALRRLVAAGTQLRAFPRDVLDACYKASMEQYAEWSAQNADFKRLYDSYSKFLDDQVSWFRVAESTYDNYMSYAKQPKKK